ncbi:ATP-binding protein [Stenotrophomonas sp. TD3]|uniref:ATP-binding protein n=1 Tax=Stenotrophomonas sp. TD3 TaxID=1641707 RepID=UPI0009512A56|nr:ATP-binding protein [Stenotrophomonas sp. TD3]
MSAPRLLRTSGFRLTLLYALITGLSFLVMFGVMYWSATHYMKEQIDGAVAAELHEVELAAAGDGWRSLSMAVDASTRAGNGFHYLVLNPDGEKVAGDLPVRPPQLGLVDGLHLPASGDAPALELRGGGRASADGGYLLVAASARQIEELQESILRSFLLGLLVSMVLVIVGGGILSAASLRRVEAMSRSSRDIMNGDLAQRLPLNGSGDEFDHLAGSLNAMLDRITTLMRGLEQVSVDIAHDLRTPLARLRQKLERIHGRGADAQALEAAVAAALDDTDAILATFAALLRISQIESGDRLSRFEPVDLQAVVDVVAEVYQPAIEDRQQQLHVESGGSLWVQGDRALLVQMLANLVENATRHSPAGALLWLCSGTQQGCVWLQVRDDGPGIPAEARERVLDRFYRLDVSRSTPGNGLGLSLVKAVAELHGATLVLEDASPGLQVTITFPQE